VNTAGTEVVSFAFHCQRMRVGGHNYMRREASHSTKEHVCQRKVQSSSLSVLKATADNNNRDDTLT